MSFRHRLHLNPESRNSSRKGNRHGLLAGILALATAVLLTGCIGWGSSALPPRLTRTEKTRLENSRNNLRAMTVGVERYQFPAYSEGLREALQRTGLFARVDDLDAFATSPAPYPTLVARVEDQIHGTAVIPAITFLSFGVIPIFVEEQHGLSFSLTRPGQRNKPVKIHCVYEGSTRFGWIALLDFLHPNRTALPFDPEKSKRFRDRLSLAILDRAKEW